MARLKSKIRKFIPFPKRKTLRKWFPPFETRNIVHLLDRNRISVVLDVGANRGQYAERLRSGGYRGRIVSFEPLAEPHRILSAAAARDSNWTVFRPVALGAEAGSVTINVYEDDSLSSAHQFTAEAAGEKGRGLDHSETVDLVPLAALFDELVGSDDRAFLKIDVQGTEFDVLKGAAPVIDRIFGLQVELPLAPMYAGEATLTDLVGHITDLGFTMTFVAPVTNRKRLGPIDQIDGLFFRGQ
ncbi:MAG: FkbM family methyltransferase [Hyphomicrobiales bacterium]|nr:FkbM family methyltransferase [Hyphomicrobiales bacterium]